MADIQDKTKLGSPSPGSSPRLARKEASPTPSGGGGVSPFSQRKREAETLQEAITATALPGDPPLLPGELLSFIAHDITYLDPFLGARTGSLYITDYKMYFKSPSDDKAEEYILHVPLGVISHVEKMGRSRSKGENAYGLEIFCKDMRTLKFAHKQETHGRRGMYERLQIVSFPISYGKNPFAYSFKQSYPTNGWEVYDPVRELKRLSVGAENVPWRISETNSDYSMCETYPTILGVPASVNDETLVLASQFRSKGRMPVLSWLHPVTHASITRSSQPLVGASRKRSKEDEDYLSAILKANKYGKKLYVMDARPKINAYANIAMGGGYELDEAYPNMDFSFLDIGNIHVMRDSLSKLQDICYPDVDDQRWYSSLEATHWLDHIKTVLGGAVKVAEVIERQRSSVLVHCTDGWDRTAQLTALAMLMLDPFYRTIQGFEIVVEKEWISFGHKFSQRLGHGDRNHSDDQRAPIFLQFIDCVWQMTVQFPYAFEFNEHFLVTILDHLYSCLFGTFIGNCEKQREKLKVRVKTMSLWSFINSQLEIYKNPLYTESIQQVLFPSASIRKLELWKGYYLRWNPRMRPQEAEFERCRHLQVLIKLVSTRYMMCSMILM
ncbi:Myotubularin-related protein 2 [Geodia barretti]|uniref:phosphatidylinositol-3,5-bisphosphate 3-phosphatase n=2 Tax=Geodia barretti TaxID=519541 RepID=A0AA35SIL2_GEOBA|nr:Myotubularin-related protein 2 [Geodia barretti]